MREIKVISFCIFLFRFTVFGRYGGEDLGNCAASMDRAKLEKQSRKAALYRGLSSSSAGARA
jgi:hypothetical protein